MQGISDESFIKTQGKGKQLNKLIPYPYTNNYLGKCNLCMDRTSDRSRLSSNHCTRWYREMSFRLLSYVPGSQTVLIKSDIYGSILPYECLFCLQSAVPISDGSAWSRLSIKTFLFWCTFYLHVYLGPQASVLFEHGSKDCDC